MSSWDTFAKAILAGATAGVGAAATALTDGAVTPAEWLTIVGAALTAAGIVYRVPNATKGEQ